MDLWRRFRSPIHFDVETSCGKKVFDNIVSNEMYPVLYGFLVVFHQSLDLDRITVLRSFNHSFDQHVDVSYLSD